ncbi:zinc-dependent alcohol dehydrogenase [Steroidobacter cummioxidans]|uniref:zinc-dependent alcohol dehydrogenase n=1 Tax=Steroidobacter cummioxidans TaxID=1803913 RepID=UPI000E3154B3|nr:zinc-binding alcohol dehydrogenase [Steroidobacter cummioxidans]
MSDRSLSFWVTGPACGEIRQSPLAAPGVGELIVQALFSGVSRGTESLVFRGKVPPSEYSRMRAPFQEGDFPTPVKYGYCMVGRVVHGPSEYEGREIFCLHPHQDRFVVPSSAVHPLPPDVPAQRAVLAANMETALNALWDAGVLPGDRVSVVGAGSVGCLVARLAARIPGCEVELIDINPRRRAIACDLGATFALPDDARGEADIVVHASGSDVGAALALRLAGFEATVLELSWYGDRQVSLPLGEAFHSRRLVLKSSQVGTVAGPRRARRTLQSRLQLALSLLNDAALDKLINSESRFMDLPRTMEQLSSAPGETIMHRVRYD